ncbi:hypothetical protein [Zhongshania marina]|uniref:Uncharacterized protein n=1 Tax=Zhongshania marina TaxID=2304603 RepID=A0A2S4HDU7_9GAMM|nr:hypothetical protein [Marortus luteolus]POP51871.1 hypothetical protein C0068_14655 [Marortus luteolus]
MKTLTKETAGSLAKVLNSQLSTIHSDDMVAILGVGRESHNEGAIQSWLLSRFADIDVSHPNMILESASEVLNQHLTDLRMEVMGGSISEIQAPHDFVQIKLLSDQELRRIARAIYFLIFGYGSRSGIDSLINLAIGGRGNSIDQIASWISVQGKTYTYFPSELTLSLAQRLMEKLKRIDESY